MSATLAVTAGRERLALAACLALLLVALLAVQSQHRYLIPPYENDFPGFAERSSSLARAVELNGYYPLGYPVLLWLVSKATSDAFSAAKVVGVVSALILALMAYLLGGILLGRRAAIWAVLLLAANPYFWESALFVGTDMPWAALQALALYGTALGIREGRGPHLAWAGAALGLAYLIRYTALVMLPVVWLYILLAKPFRQPRGANLRAGVAFTLAFLLFAMPQLWASWQAKGTPFYTLQAKNVWFGIYGEGDWQAHWTEVPGEIGLWRVFAMGPARFLSHWARGLAEWLAYTGVLAVGLSRLAFQELNVVGRAILGVIGSGSLLTLLIAIRSGIGARLARPSGVTIFLLAYYLAYGLSIALAFVQPRFFLALLPAILVAALAILEALRAGKTPLVARWLRYALVAFSVLHSGLTLYLALGRLQPPVGGVVAQLEQAGARQDDVILSSFEIPYRYHTAYDVRALPKAADEPGKLLSVLKAEGAKFLLLEEAYTLRYWPGLSALLYGAEAPQHLRLIWRQPSPPVALYAIESGY